MRRHWINSGGGFGPQEGHKGWWFSDFPGNYYWNDEIDSIEHVHAFISSGITELNILMTESVKDVDELWK